jgi:ribonucleoside-diphosphate reductase alpha chain
MPAERSSITHRFKIRNAKGYITVGIYADGSPGEIFIVANKVGTTEKGLLHALAVVVSIALQHGVPLVKITNKLKGLQFDPQGITSNPDIRITKSLVDYAARWLELKFLGEVSQI